MGEIELLLLVMGREEMNVQLASKKGKKGKKGKKMMERGCAWGDVGLSCGHAFGTNHMHSVRCSTSSSAVVLVAGSLLLTKALKLDAHRMV